MCTAPPLASRWLIRLAAALQPMLAALLTAVLIAAPASAVAWELAGTKTLTATTREHTHIPLGTVRFEPQADGGTRFSVTLDDRLFTDHFLSMKEFKCLDGPAEVLCHVPYPYPQPRTVRPGDWAWLEHSLLFLYKLPSEFGAKFWNGLYYRFELTEAGLVGTPQAIDLNLISAPPDHPTVPPFRPALRDDVAPGTRWIERLTIE